MALVSVDGSGGSDEYVSREIVSREIITFEIAKERYAAKHRAIDIVRAFAQAVPCRPTLAHVRGRFAHADDVLRALEAEKPQLVPGAEALFQ